VKKQSLNSWWMIVLAAWVAAIAFAPMLRARAITIHLEQMFAPFSWSLPLGADDLGRSVAARVIGGAALSCPLAVVVVIMTVTLGTAFGVACGWRGGAFDVLGTRLIDVFMAFPGFLLAIALAGLLGPGLSNVVVALSAVGWVGYARLARAQTLSLKTREHVLVARTLGTSDTVILIRHVLPLMAAPLLVESVFGFAAVIAQEAGLSFLGLGAPPPTPAWGVMLRDAAQFLLIAPHLLLGPGGAILSLLLAVQAAGEWLRRRLQLPVIGRW
jgi:peptide/nickel transport system permease protein